MSIEVHIEDTISLADKSSNMGNRPIRKKAIHEKLFDQYGINEKDLVESSNKTQKNIPNDWIIEIIKDNISLTETTSEIKPYHKQFSGKTLVLIFENTKAQKQFKKEYDRNLFKSINSVIESKHENPKDYNRTIIFEVSGNNQRLDIILS